MTGEGMVIMSGIKISIPIPLAGYDMDQATLTTNTKISIPIPLAGYDSFSVIDDLHLINFNPHTPRGV